MKKIFIFAEQSTNVLNPVSLELLAKAKEMAAAYGEETQIAAVLLGDNVSSMAKTLAEHGAGVVYVGDAPELRLYCHTTYAPVIADLIKKEDPDIFLFGATAIGSELAPTVAGIVKTGVAAHCVDLKINDTKMLSSMVPSFGGKIIGEILIPDHRPQMASVKPGIFIKDEPDASAKANVVSMDLSSAKKASAGLKPVSVCVTEPKGVPIEKADVVIVGGFGIGAQKNWDMIEEIATLLGGAAGCTRPTVDAGWAPGEHVMIGTSGKSIRPKNYIGFGISGATHHICGMKDSGLVINVNTDEKAASFEVSDYCVVGDLNKLLPALLEEIKACKKAANCTF